MPITFQTLFYGMDKEDCRKYKGKNVMSHGTRKNNKANRMKPDRSHGQRVGSTIPRQVGLSCMKILMNPISSISASSSCL